MDEVTFDIETQAAAAITNVGEQTVYAGERRSWFARWGVVLGVVLSLGGLGVLVLTGIRTAETLLANDFWPPEVSYYADQVESTWIPAVVLLATGLVIKRLAKAAR